MPIVYCRQREKIPIGTPEQDFDTIDRIVIGEVFPHVEWENLGRLQHIELLPNRSPRYKGITMGPTIHQDPQKYFVLACLRAGLSYADTGLWLDHCLRKYIVTNSDGVKRQFSAPHVTMLRLDRRRPAYYLDGTARHSLEWRK